MVHSGSCASQVRDILTSLNIPCPTERNLKKREREAGEYLEMAAKHACTEAVRREKELTLHVSFGDGPAMGQSATSAAQCPQQPAVQEQCIGCNSSLCSAGLTYSSGCGLVDQPCKDDISTEIPEAVIEPRLQLVNKSGVRNVVFFDLETTGRSSHTCEIAQIAATYTYVEADEEEVEGEKTGKDDKADKKKLSFSTYILPEIEIDRSASHITAAGLSIGLRSGKSVLLKNNVPVTSNSLADGLKAFIDWLPEKCLLAAHNCNTFDAVVTVRQLEKVGLAESFAAKVQGFADTLPVLPLAVPGLKSSSLSYLVSKDLEAHNALADVHTLLKVIA